MDASFFIFYFYFGMVLVTPSLHGKSGINWKGEGCPTRWLVRRFRHSLVRGMSRDQHRQLLSCFVLSNLLCDHPCTKRSEWRVNDQWWIYRSDRQSWETLWDVNLRKESLKSLVEGMEISSLIYDSFGLGLGK